MKITELKQVDIKHIPRQPLMEEGILYVSKEFETAIHLCACGCKGQVVTPLDPVKGWTLTEGPTLSPSIGNQHWDCKSHYFVTNGKIINLPS